jgi:hypothetical protein
METISSLIAAGCMAWITVLGVFGQPVLAQNCTVDCGSGAIQFTPGDRITVEVKNLTNVAVAVEQPPLIPPITLLPGTSTDLGFGWGTTPNLSMFFWTLDDQPIRVRLGRPAESTLSLEIYSAPSEPSDRSIYIENDGRVIIK